MASIEAAGPARPSPGWTANADAYLPLRDLALYAGLSIRTLRDRLHDPAGPLPHYRIGGKILVRKSDYDAWAQRFRQACHSTLDDIVDGVLDELR